MKSYNNKRMKKIYKKNNKKSYDFILKFAIIVTVVIVYLASILSQLNYNITNKANSGFNYKFYEAQDCLNYIFDKNYGDNDTLNLINNYQTICKEPDTELFLRALIEQLKVDYGIEQVNTSFYYKPCVTNNNNLYGSTSCYGDIYIYQNPERNQKDYFNTAFHELKHVKQYADAYRTDPDKLAEAIVKRNNNGYASVYDIQHTRNELDEIYGALKPFPKNSKEYKKGLEYIENQALYNSAPKNYNYDLYEKYRNQIVEKEAFLNGAYSETIYNYAVKSNIK